MRPNNYEQNTGIDPLVGLLLAWATTRHTRGRIFRGSVGSGSHTTRRADDAAGRRVPATDRSAP